MIDINDMDLVAIVSYFLYGFNCECDDSDKGAIDLIETINRYTANPQEYKFSEGLVEWRKELDQWTLDQEKIKAP